MLSACVARRSHTASIMCIGLADRQRKIRVCAKPDAIRVSAVLGEERVADAIH